MAMEAAEVVMEAVEMAMAGAEMMGLVDGRSADAECDGSGGDGDGRGGQGRIHCKACKESSVGERIRVGAAQARALDGEAVACGAVAYPPVAAASRNSMVMCGGAGVRKAGSIAQRSKPDFRLVRLSVCRPVCRPKFGSTKAGFQLLRTASQISPPAEEASM